MSRTLSRVTLPDASSSTRPATVLTAVFSALMEWLSSNSRSAPASSASCNWVAFSTSISSITVEFWLRARVTAALIDPAVAI